MTEEMSIGVAKPSKLRRAVSRLRSAQAGLGQLEYLHHVMALQEAAKTKDWINGVHRSALQHVGLYSTGIYFEQLMVIVM